MLTIDIDLLPVIVAVGVPQLCVQQTCNSWQAGGRACGKCKCKCKCKCKYKCKCHVH